MKYYDFTILIGSDNAGQYSVRAESERHGEPESMRFVLPGAIDLEAIRKRFENRDTDRAFLEATGRDLFNRIFAGQLKDTFLLSLGEVRNDADLGLRIRLRIGAPEVAALPWELLYSDLDEAFLGTRTKTPLVRYLDMPSPIGELTTPFPIRMLVAIPRGNESSVKLDAAAEKTIIEGALDGLGDKVHVTYLHELYADGKVTWHRIAECMAGQAFHCFHFVGHGTFHKDHGYLVLDGEDAKDDPVDDERFAELFVNSPSIRLVVLNACKGATLSSSQPLAGSAARLVRRGVPAVVAMQFSIYDNAALAFARSFYHSLFASDDRGRVDVAVSRGRQSLAATFAGQREVCAPVLFVHAKSSLLFVPESEGMLANLPKNRAQLDTLGTARDAASSELEAAKFSRRIKIAKGSVQTALTAGLLVFFLSMIRLLDIFTIDTQAEFAVMALGNGLADHEISDHLRIVTIDGKDLGVNELRQRVGGTIVALDSAGAAVVALDIFYPAENGAFKTDPPSGQRLVATIGAVNIPVVIGAQGAKGKMLDAPDTLQAAVASVGHLCFESKLGLARSLPISVDASGQVFPSLVLAAVAAFEGGRVLTGPEASVEVPVVVFADRPSKRFAVSEVNKVWRRTKDCELIRNDDQAAHRYIRLAPPELLAKITMADVDLEARLAAEPNLVRAAYRDKLVLVGVLGRGDVISDLAGPRAGVLWQADALNSLLLDTEIVPVSDSWQLVLMLALAGLAAVLKLQWKDRGRWRVMVPVLVSVVIVALTIYFYGVHGLLLNPVYCLLALWIAWWMAGRFGKTWLTK
jgi:hypothetical protein